MESSLIKSSARSSAAEARAVTRPLPQARVLQPEFYQRDTLKVAQDLLGKILAVRTREGWCAGRIVETEGYHGDDPAAHCSRGETPRTRVMFGDPGVAYVYFIYGNYEMLNFVTERKGYPGAVLIRALEPVLGEKLMRRRRRGLSPSHWTNGPGKLCHALGIRMSHNGAPLQGPDLWVLDDGFAPARISRSRRVGINVGRERLWRFFVTDSSFVSRAPENKEARRVRRRAG